MGCNLCSFQRREEHYKLLYEVSQVSAEAVASVRSSVTKNCVAWKTLNLKGVGEREIWYVPVWVSVCECRRLLLCLGLAANFQVSHHACCN